MTYIKPTFHLQQALKDFELAVKNDKTKRYEKMIYNYWARLKQIDDASIQINIERYISCREGNSIISITDLNTNQDFCFTNDDRSFGEFLSYHLTEYIDTTTNNCNDTFLSSTINKNIKGENKEMENMLNFDFGPCKNNDIRVSTYGLAVKNSANNWVSYDPISGKIIDVSVFNFDGKRFFYKIPVAIKDVKVGDMIIHDRKPVYVSAINEKTLSVIDIRASEVTEILPISNMFGFDFVTKVVSILDYFGGFNASADSPFGNILPFLMMGDGDIDNIFPFLLMGNDGANFANNPILLYFLMKDKKEANDFLPFLFLNNNNASVKN